MGSGGRLALMWNQEATIRLLRERDREDLAEDLEAHIDRDR